jgi:hypothetical protein
MADNHRPIRIQLLGLVSSNINSSDSAIVVDSIPYDNTMGAQGGNDSDIAAVLTFVRAMFNKATDSITVNEVGQVRDSLCATADSTTITSCSHTLD